MGRTSVLLLVGIGVCAAALAYWLGGSEEPSSQLVDVDITSNVDLESSADVGSEAENSATPSPFALGNSSTIANDSAVAVENPVSRVSEANTLDANQGTEAGRLFAKSVDVTTVGRSQISDSDFLQLADALRSDPILLQQLIDELRQETNAERRALIVSLLGEVGGESITLTASELIYSGDATNRQLGLNLLQQIQPGNSAARDIASTLLATEIEPSVLVDTLSTLSSPTASDEASRDFLIEQVAFLTSHDDATVRSISLNILSRWSKDGQFTEVLRSGLIDAEPAVRGAAAYALVDHENVSPALVNSLLSVAVNPTEYERARRGAILALKGMPIEGIVREQVMAAEMELDIASRQR